MGMDLTAWLEKQHILSFYFREMEEGETIYIYDTIKTRDAQSSHMGNIIVRWPKKSSVLCLQLTELSDGPLLIRNQIIRCIEFTK